MRIGAACAALLAVALAGADPGAAQEPPPYAWESAFRMEIQDFTVDSVPWSTWFEATAGVKRVLDRGSIRFEVANSRRFDAWDAAVAGDVWWQLWERAYGNARLEVAPDAAGRAELDLQAALYQGLDPAWEVGVAWRRQHFASDVDVDALTLTAARYLDAAYLRGGVTLSGRDGIEGAAVDGTARWYFQPPEDLVEIGAQWGETPEFLGAGPVVGFDQGGHGHARIQMFPWPFVGFGLSAEVRFFRHVPVRHGVSASVHARW